MADLNNLHVTLSPLGEITESQNAAVQKALKGVEFSPFRIKMVGMGVFPKSGYPNTIWIGIDPDGTKRLAALAREVRAALAPIGLDKRPFRPHIAVLGVGLWSMAALNEAVERAENCSSIEFGSCSVSGIKLKKSVRTRDGPIYSDLFSLKFDSKRKTWSSDEGRADARQAGGKA